MTQFNEEMMIWQYALYHDKLDDYLEHASQLIIEWTDSLIDISLFKKAPHTFFRSELDFQIALYLLNDGLLPLNAQMILANAVLLGRFNLISRNIKCEMLKVSKEKKAGRPSEKAKFTRSKDVLKLLELGFPRSEAYEQVAVQYCKSNDTIRRAFERHIKSSKGLRDKLSHIYPRNNQ
jgi:hypothetical protein